MNSSLKDVRIVENGIVRDYYIEIDFPNKDYATVWFETNITAINGASEQDTYMYFGNNSVNYDGTHLMSNNPDGLIWYKFEEIIDEGARDVIVDSMGNYNATVYGGTTLTSDKAVGNNALSFDGNNDWLAIQKLNYSLVNEIPELTVCVWFKTDYIDTSNFDNWAFFDFDRSEYFNFFINPLTETLGFATTADRGAQSANTNDFYGTTDLVDNTWHFAAARYDGDDKYLYKDNGVQDNVILNPHNGYAIGDVVGDDTNDAPRFGIIGDGSEAYTEGGSRNNVYYQGLLDEIRYFEYDIMSEHPNRIYWISNDFKVRTENLTIQNKEATIKVIAKDIDGRVVDGLEISLVNDTGIQYTQTTGELGEHGYTEFLNVRNDWYNITANYTINNGTYNSFEKVVFNSSEYGIQYNFDQLQHTVYINVSLWSIDFEIEDWDLNPMGYGYVLIYNKSDYSEQIANLTLNKALGTQTFRWINTSANAKYYYELYYDNSDYTKAQTLLNKTSVNRSDYLNNKFNDIPIINVNETNQEDGTGLFHVQERFYATDSNLTHIGNTKIINMTLSMSNMKDNLTSISLRYIDQDNVVSAVIYSELYTTETSDVIKLNVTEYGDAYGLQLDIWGENSTYNCNGTIDVNYTEANNHYIKTNMSKLEIYVYDLKGEWRPEYGNVFVNVRNGTDDTLVTQLLTDNLGRAKGQNNPELDFWYIRNSLYNFTLTYGGADRLYNATSDNGYTTLPGQWLDQNTPYNFTLQKYSNITFQIKLSMANFSTEFQEKTWIPDNDEEWGQSFTFRVRFMSTDNFDDPYNPPIWSPVTLPNFIVWEVKDSLGDVTLLSGNMQDDPLGDGYYNYTLDTSVLIGDENYIFVVYGSKSGYQTPDPAQFSFTVSPKSTSIGVYDSSLNNLGSGITVYYGTSVNLIVLYQSGGNLQGATVTYDWAITTTPITTTESPPGQYSFTIDTSDADVGLYPIQLSASLQNYSTQTFSFNLQIIHRPTALNGDEELHHISKSLWVGDPYNFTFKYQDTLSNPDINLTSVDDAYYQWYQLDTSGNIIGNISSKIDLIEGADETYVLDFNTSTRAVGDYALYVTMQKNNYEVRTALIDLAIETRVFSATLPSDKFTDNIITVYTGDPIFFNISLSDLTRNIALTGATVEMEFQNKTYSFNEDGGGEYSINITDHTELTASDISNTSTTSIIVSKSNFVTQTIDITVILSNRMFNSTLSAEFEGQLLTIVSGEPLSFDLNVIHSDTAAALLDATITIKIQNEIFDDVSVVDNGDGTYTITLLSYPDAFFRPEIIAGEIIVEKENYKTESISFTIEIEMVEVIPGSGFPMFYFLMLVISIGAVVGSLATYRYIQVARIPTFIKDVRKMKSEIKGRKQISESLEYPSKEEYIVKKLGDKWRMLGISLTDILGIEVKKAKTLPEAKEAVKKPEKTPDEKAKIKAEEKAKKKAEKEAEAKRKAEEKAKKQVEKEAETKRKAEEKAKKQTEKEAEAKKKEDVKKKAEEEAKGGEE
jgi:hypothetical protein